VNTGTLAITAIFVMLIVFVDPVSALEQQQAFAGFNI
jgi:hypothetical protein